MTIALETHLFCKNFGGLTAVDCLDIQVPELSISSVIGPNGAGKTTFFNCISGFYEPDSGDALLWGKPITGFSPDRVAALGVGRTFQNIRLFANMTTIENIQVGMEPHLKSGVVGTILRLPGTSREEASSLAEARRLLNFVGLSGRGDLLAKNLPYGDQRRLELGRALAAKPNLLLLDEPTAGMNPRESQQTMLFIKRLRDELGITILLIEHDMRVVMGISEKITVLDYGKKIAEGTPAEIQRNPLVIEAYLGRGAATGLQQAGAQA